MGHTTRLHKKWRQATSRTITDAAQKMIDTYELDATLIVGTGKDGNVIVKDVKNYMKALSSSEEE